MLKKFLLPALLLLSACVPELKQEPLSAGSANLNRPVILGGSLLSGYRDGALFDAAQETGVGNQLLQSFSEVSGISFVPWTMGSEEGLGWNFNSSALPYRTRGRLANLPDCEGTIALGVDRDYLSLSDAQALSGSLNLLSVPQNLAIPLASLGDLRHPSFSRLLSSGGRNPFFSRIAILPDFSSVLGDAWSMNPTFFVFQPGLEDILNWASLGMSRQEPLPAAEFESLLDSMLEVLTANGAKGVLLNIPDPDAMPFFTTFPSLGLEIDSVKADTLNMLYNNPPFNEIQFHAGSNGFVIYDSSTASDYRLTTEEDRILLNAPKDSIKCKKWGIVFTPLPDSVVIRSDEMLVLRARISAYNSAIRNMATKYNLALAEIADFFESVKATYREDGVDYSSVFVSGGFFSLDGLNPTPRGAALIANVVIRAINAKYQANIPTRVHSLYEGIIFP